MTTTPVFELCDMLRTRRAGRTRTEKRFVANYVDSLPGVSRDQYGNRYVRVGGTGAPPVMWSCHTDSVHTMGGAQSIIGDGDLIRLDPANKESNCLGADDATGVWLMRQMILRQIPGLYIFHRDEETGGRGSDWIVRNNASALDGIQWCIALDRKGRDSVITHQGARTASDQFARDMAAQLGGEYKPDSGGIFTDSANYRDLIPECSNLSIGYGDAHSPGEYQDARFALELLEKLCALDFSSMTVSRNPAQPESWSDYYAESRDFDDMWLYPERRRLSAQDNYRELVALLRDYPEDVADYLERQGFGAHDIADEIGLYGLRHYRGM